jgi:NitT/TauT family transport system substrate-binding protein
MGDHTMPSIQEMPLIRIAPNNPVFDLPVIVGIEEGLFAQAGLDVRFSATYADREKDRADGAIMSRLKENLFDCGSADSYNVCEWASIDRLERGTRGGNIAALRAAVAAQAILTFDESLQVPRDLADVPVVVQELTGSHYTTLQMLESAVGPEHVTIGRGGLPQKRWEGLKNGTHRAVAVMEPFISLGLKEGAHIVAAAFYRGGEVISADLTGEQRKAYYDAENEAVDRINADFYKYAHHVTAHAKGALQPHELLRAFVRYKHVDYYDTTLFGRTYDWMRARGLTEGQSEHAALVAG